MTRLHSSAIGHVRLALQLPVTAPPALDCLLQQRVEVHFRRGIDSRFSNSSVNTGDVCHSEFYSLLLRNPFVRSQNAIAVTSLGSDSFDVMCVKRDTHIPPMNTPSLKPSAPLRQFIVDVERTTRIHQHER
ncbi:hypothetical protein FVER53590_30001 [Fusarium verticillioides]|nr:hypothetical protein FVER53590_30001 [Fusarium verticillioides]